MIEKISIWEDNPDKSRVSKVVRVQFKYKTDWCIFTIEELMEILKYWIIGEEIKYPQSKGYKGRWMLYDKITEVFDTTPVN